MSTRRLEQIPLFQELEPDVRQQLASAARPVELEANQVLFQQGDACDSLYLVQSGHLVAHIHDNEGNEITVDQLTRGDIIGEVALLTGQPRTATITALEDSQLLQIMFEDFKEARRQDGALESRLMGNIVQRIQRAQLTGVLSALFGPLEQDDLHKLQEALPWRHLTRGDVLMKQGDEARVMYIVVNGRLRVSIQENGQERTLIELGRGETVGEYGLLTGDPRSADVAALRNTSVVEINEDIFQRLSRENPLIMTRLAQRLVQRAVHQLQDAPACPHTWAILPVGDVDVDRIARALTQATEAIGHSLLLNQVEMDRRFGREGIAETPTDNPLALTLEGWLMEQERHYQFIFYQADREQTHWTERALHHADRVLLVGEGSAPQGPELAGRKLAEIPEKMRVELILLAPEGVENPTGTARWLDALPSVYTHHHVTLDRDRSFRRLARRLTGQAVGTVLSGGGARGLAHVGALRALQEAGIEMDMIGGTSIGSIIAAGAALGWDPEKMQELARTFSDSSRLLDRTLPLVSLYETAGVTATLQELFGDVRIEDLWQPFFCVSSNLSQGAPHVHRQGPLWKAVRASLAIPGLFAPVLFDGEVHVDGGIMKNLPLDVMYEQVEGGTVIAINASPRKTGKSPYTFGPSISGWRVLRSRLSPFEKPIKVPSITGTILRSLEVNSTYNLRNNQQMADLLIEPDTHRFDIMDWDAYQGIIDVGYQAARQALVGWQPPT